MLQEVTLLQVAEIIAVQVVPEIITREVVLLEITMLEADRVVAEAMFDLPLLREVEVAVALHHLRQEVHLDQQPHLQEVVQDVQIEDKN